jgi:hypothetical protein
METPAPRMSQTDPPKTRHKGGRPKAAHPRAHIVQTRLTDAELATVLRCATSCHTTPSEYLRRAVLAGAKPPRRGRNTKPAASVHPSLDPALVLELHRIGVNLNQIARAYNSGQPMPDALTAACERFTRILDALHV